MAAAFLSCSRWALSSAACALAVALARRSRSLSRATSSRRCSAWAAFLLLLEVGGGLSGFSFADFRSSSLRRLRPMSCAPGPVLTGSQVGRKIGLLGEAAVRSRRALEHHAWLRHRCGDHAWVVCLLGDALMEEIAASAPGLECRFHRRRRNREIVEAQRRPKCLELPCHGCRQPRGFVLVPGRDPGAE